MSKIIFAGYSPASKSPERNQQERHLFIQHHALLLDNRERIDQCPEMFFCQPAGSYLSLAYIGGGKICLGVLLQLWADGIFKQPCPKCTGQVWLMGIGGSPLSGCNNWWGFCPDCKSGCDGEVKSGGFSKLYAPALKLIHKHPNYQTIRRGARAKFSWSKGRVGQDEPDIIVKDKVYGMSLEQVIERLIDGPCNIINMSE